LLRRIHAEHLDGLGLSLMFRRRFPRPIWRGDFLKDKELTRKPRGHESGEFVNRVFGKTKAAPTTVPGQSGKSRKRI
jgi:hypothetical protein